MSVGIVDFFRFYPPGAMTEHRDGDAQPEQPAARPELSPRREKMRHKRVQVAQELLATEETYVKNLEDLMTVFCTPLEQNAASKNEEERVITKDDTRTIFGSLKMILPVNRMLLQDLKERLSVTEDQYVLVGDSFKNMVRFYYIAPIFPYNLIDPIF